MTEWIFFLLIMLVIVIITVQVINYMSTLYSGVTVSGDRYEHRTEEVVTLGEPISEDEYTVSNTIPMENVLEVDTCTVTAYAPLDADAVEGMCYSGDPTIGANNKKVVPYQTVAAPKRIPFGTKVKIENFPQVFIVGDRGGAIKGKRLDICMKTRLEALQFGRQKLKVMYFN